MVDLRQATELGFQKGQAEFEVQLNSKILELAEVGLITNDAYFGADFTADLFGSQLVAGDDYDTFPCKHFSQGFDEPATTCRSIVLFAKSETFKQQTSLTAVTELPQSIQDGPNKNDAHNALTQGFGAGVRSAVEYHRWALRSQEICDRFFEISTGKEKPLPIIEAYWKGLSMGMQYFSTVLNDWMIAYDFTAASWPEDISTIDLCNLNDLMLFEAREEAEAGYEAQAVEDPVCGSGFNPPATQGIPEGFAEMEESFLAGFEDGFQAEFTIAASELWSTLECVPTMLTY